MGSNKSCSSELASVMAGEVGGVIASASSAEGGASVAAPGANSTSNTTTPANYQKLSDEQFKEHAEQIEKVRQIVAKLTKKENLSTHKLSYGRILTFEELTFLIKQSKIIISNQPIILHLDAPIKIFGDIHGQYHDLLQWFEMFDNEIAGTLFLGDYVDRGSNSIETISLLLAFKLMYPLSFFLLRGNHESMSVNRIYGFFDEVKSRYNNRLYKLFSELFDMLPVAAVIEGKIFCCHGGLPKNINCIEEVKQLQRPMAVPNEGSVCDLLWADPAPDKSVANFGRSERGVSHSFGHVAFEKFLIHNNFDLMVRAHQICQDGYEFFHKQSGLTLFSAPNYCGEFDNAGAALTVNSELQCSFKILKSTARNDRTYHYTLPSISDILEIESKPVNNTATTTEKSVPTASSTTSAPTAGANEQTQNNEPNSSSPGNPL